VFLFLLPRNATRSRKGNKPLGFLEERRPNKNKNNNNKMSSDTGSISGPKIVSVDDIFDSLRYANGQVISGSRAKPTHQGGTVSKCHGVNRTH